MVRKMLRRRVSLILLCLLLLTSFQPYIVTAEGQTEDQVESAPIEIQHYEGTDEFTLRVRDYSTTSAQTCSTPLLTTDVIVDDNLVYPLGLYGLANSGLIYFDVNNLSEDAHIRRINPLTHKDYYREYEGLPQFYDPAIVTFDIFNGTVYAIAFSADWRGEGLGYHYNVIGFAIWRKGEFNYTYLYPFKENYPDVYIPEIEAGRSFIKYHNGLVFISVMNFWIDPVNNSYTMIFNVTDLSDVKLLANFSYDYPPCDDINDRLLLLFVENYLYLAKTYGELEIIDISDPSNPTFVKKIDMNSTIFDMKYDSTKKIIYIAGGISGLKIFDVSDASSPTLLQTYNSTLKCSFGVEIINENTVAVGDGVFGVHILNVSSLENIVEISSIKTNDRAYHMAYYDDKLIVADMSGGLYIIDISDIADPKSICTQIIIGSKLSLKYGVWAIASGSWDDPGAFLHFSADKLWLFYGEADENYGIGSNLDFFPAYLILYNDTDNNDKLTTEYIKGSPYNPSIIGQIKVVDEVYCAGRIWDNIPPSNWVLENCTREGVNGIKATVQLTNISLESNIDIENFAEVDSVNWVGGQGKANVLITVWFLPKVIVKDNISNVLNVTVKMDFAIEFNDLELYGNPEKFSVYLSFYSMGWGGTYGGYPAYSIIEGHDTPKYSLIATKEMGFVCANTNVTISENGINRTQNIYVSNDYSGRYLELTEWTILGLNFHNITSNSKIYYDPRINVWVSFNLFTMGGQPPEEQPPEEQPPEGPPRPQNNLLVVILVAAISATVAFLMKIRRIRTKKNM